MEKRGNGDDLLCLVGLQALLAGTVDKVGLYYYRGADLHVLDDIEMI
jgi:hypothetical protein